MPLGAHARKAQEHGLHLSVVLNPRRSREPSLWKPVAGWMEELVKQETSQEGLSPPGSPSLQKPVSSVEAHLTSGVLRILFSPRPDRHGQ